MGKHEIKIPLDDETAKYLTTALNELYDRLDKMSYDELKAWYEENLTLPSYTTEIDGNLITVQSHFNGQANETILQKIVRLLGIKIKYEQITL